MKPGAGIGLRGWSKVRKMPGKVGCVASVSSDLAENQDWMILPMEAGGKWICRLLEHLHYPTSPTLATGLTASLPLPEDSAV